MTQIIDFDADFYVQTNVPCFIPSGSNVNNCTYSDEYECWIISVHCSYDYSPFVDSKAPTFEFEADEITVDSAGEINIESSVIYISSPDGHGSRLTTKKES